jgi:hypothetical protein
MKKTVVSIIMVSVLLLTAFGEPVLASTGMDNIQADNAATTVNATKLPKLTINNKTGQQLSLTLQGPKFYSLKVPTGKSSFEVEQGRYTYSYFACGKTQTGQLAVKKDGLSVKFECGGQEDKSAKLPKLTVNNTTGETFRIKLSGPKTYNFSLKKGKSNFEVEPGKYTYSYFACGETQTGKLTVKKKGASVKFTCDSKKDQSTTAPKLTINNNTGESFRITLSGPETYYFSLQKGKAKFEVKQGKYDYTYTACGGPQSGKVNVNKKGATLKLNCPKSAQKDGQLIKVSIKNQTGGYVTLSLTSLTGSQSYSFSLAPGASKIEVAKGKYSFTAWGCGGGSLSGTRNIKGQFVWKWFCN